MSESELRIRANFMRDRRVSRLAEGPCYGAALAMFLEGCCNSARDEQDGVVTRGEAIRMGLHREAASELVRVGLWGQIDDGFEIIDWPELFPSESRAKARRAADASRKARQRGRDRVPVAQNHNVGRTTSTDHGTTGLGIDKTVSTAAPDAAAAESRSDSDTFEAWLDESEVTSSHTASRTESTTVTGTQPQNSVTGGVTARKSISPEVGTELALKDLNLKKEINSPSTPPQQSSIEAVAVQTIRTNAVRNDVRKQRRPAARRAAREDHLRLSFDGEVSAKPKEESKPQLDDFAAAARGARLVFEATTMQHSPCSPKHKASCEWLGSRPESEWAIAKPVLLAEANKLDVRHMLTPQHIADHWPTHYSVGKAPRGRAALERERAALKPVRGFQGLQPLPTLAEYEAEYAKAQAGTLGRLGAATC